MVAEECANYKEKHDATRRGKGIGQTQTEPLLQSKGENEVEQERSQPVDLFDDPNYFEQFTQNADQYRKRFGEAPEPVLMAAGTKVREIFHKQGLRKMINGPWVTKEQYEKPKLLQREHPQSA